MTKEEKEIYDKRGHGVKTKYKTVLDEILGKELREKFDTASIEFGAFFSSKSPVKLKAYDEDKEIASFVYQNANIDITSVWKNNDKSLIETLKEYNPVGYSANHKNDCSFKEFLAKVENHVNEMEETNQHEI